jgi:hypothetical protein
MVEAKHGEGEFSNPRIKYEYTGNFYSSVRFDQNAIENLEFFIGGFTKTLRIVDGPERVERFNLAWTGKEPDSTSHPPFGYGLELKEAYNITPGEEEDTLAISSQVIDGRVQLYQRYHGLSYRDYELHFKQGLVNIVRVGVYHWTRSQLEEAIKRESFLTRRRKRKDFKKLWEVLGYKSVKYTS